MSGEDINDPATKDNPKDKKYWQELSTGNLEGLRLGVNTRLLSDSIYKLTIEKLALLGVITIEFDPEQIEFDDFGKLLSADMKIDLPAYLDKYGADEIELSSVADIVDYNKQDSLVRIPYGQARFEGILDVSLSPEELAELKLKLHNAGVSFFEVPMQEYQLDAVLSINNRYAGYAAAALYPCLTIPMGYREDGEPVGLTFIARPFEEDKLLKIAYAFEQATKMRKFPADYR